MRLELLSGRQSVTHPDFLADINELRDWLKDLSGQIGDASSAAMMADDPFEHLERAQEHIDSAWRSLEYAKLSMQGR